MANETMQMKTTGIEKQEIALTSSVAGLTAELEASMGWLRAQRRQAPPNADVWHLCHHWETERDILKQQLAAGTCRLSPMQVVGRDKKKVQWGARDALVLKWLTQRLSTLLPVHPRCEHVKGHGGGRASVSRLSEAASSGEYGYVCRTDIRGYYGAINKATVLRQVQQYVQDPVLLGLVRQYLHYSVEDGGEFYTPGRGICRGCSLSPLLGALHLYEVDAHFSAQEDIVYARYMDDFVILAKSRWALRRQVRALNGYFAQYGFEQHPDKTFIGRVSRGLDWLGAWLDDTGVTGIAPRALANHRERVRRLYKQLRRWPKDRRQCRVSQYRVQWAKWALTVLPLFAAASCHAGWTQSGAIHIPAGDKCVPHPAWSYSDNRTIINDASAQAATGVSAADPDGHGIVGLGSGNGYVDAAYGAVTATVTAAAIPGCPGLTGIKVGDHLYATAKSATAQLAWANTSRFTPPPPLVTGGLSGYNASWQATAYDLAKVYPPDLGKPYNSLYARWPGQIDYQSPGAKHDPAPPGIDTITASSSVSLSVVWDGEATTSPQSIGGVAGASTTGTWSFAAVYSCSQCGNAYWSTVYAPAIMVSLEQPRPACSTSVGGNVGGVSLVGLNPVAPACPGGACTKVGAKNLANTSFGVTCTSTWGAYAATVKPRLTFKGNLDGVAGAYLLKTTQSGVFIWGTTSATADGCQKWGATASDMTGFAPFDGTTHWEPGWTDTSSNWMGSTWKSSTATMYWGVCLDNTAGGRTITAGPFSASATWTLHVD